MDSVVLLHIPDGFLSLPVALACWLTVVVIQGIAARRAAGSSIDRRVPLMGVMAAFIFAAQMINFPVAGGTSGHLVGGALATIALGPWAATVVLTSVVATQAFFFQDGGLVALGANILNMGIVPAVVGHGLYRPFSSAPRPIRLGAAGVVAWLTVVVAAILTAVQLSASGTVALSLALPAMVGVHALIGIGEAAITVAALSFISAVRPDLIRSPERFSVRWTLAGLAVAGGIVALAPVASSDPDGLERIASDLGFLSRASAAPIRIFGDYMMPGVTSEPVAVILAGLVGVMLVVAVTLALGRLSRRAARHAEPGA